MLATNALKRLASFGAAILFSSGASANSAFFVSLDDIATYDSSRYSQAVTECDLLAGHPDDPMRVADGVTQEAMDKPAAIKACLLSIKTDPENPRLNYQLARAYGYSNMHAEATPYREKALRSGYPQSLFVLGFIRVTGWDGAPSNACYGGELIRRAAQVGHYAGNVYYPRYALQGLLNDCADAQQPDWDDVERMLSNATTKAKGVYEHMLIEVLKEQLEQRRGEENQQAKEL